MQIEHEQAILLAATLTEVLDIVLYRYDNDIPVNDTTIANLRNILSQSKELLA